MNKSSRRAIFKASILAALLIVIFNSTATAESYAEMKSASPMNVAIDSGSFAFYLNEEILCQSHCEWKEDGSFSGKYKMTMAGQSATTTMDIKVDEKGDWTKITMYTAAGPVQVAREDTIATITALGKNYTVEIKPGMILFENFNPSLITQAVAGYDQEIGGKQQFPLFIIPSTVLEANLEKLETVQREIEGELQTFTTYRYGLPGVDVFIWMDDHNRFIYGDVPAQHGAYVRTGYEILMQKEVVDTLVSQPIYEVILEKDIRVPMRDGLELATDIYRPDSDGQHPVILVRTPYKKELNELQGRYFARRGYIYAVQDCRGRFGSPGEWVPFFNEPNDGYDAVEWLAVRPWANGKVGMIGASYLGWVQWWAARNRPPHLTTIIPNVSPPDPFYNIPYEYGAFFLTGAIWWADILEQEATDDITGKAMRDINKKNYAKLLRHLPVIELDSIVLGKTNQYWRDWIAHPNNDDYWEEAGFINHLADLDIPVYHQSGWYDGDGIGSKLNYAAMTAHGHKNQKLVLGPWGHTAKATRTGPNFVDFGPEATIDLETSYTRWLDRWLLGIDNGIEKEPLVSVFAMGSNQWFHGDTYPLPETEFTRFYLSGEGRANTLSGDGLLTPELPAESGTVPDTFTYNPGDPTPDPNFYFDPKDLTDEDECDSTETVAVKEKLEEIKAFYHQTLEERSDILVYVTKPMDRPLTFVGPISAVLYAASSARDTDWFMRLSTVDEDDVVFPLVHGVIRARHRNSCSEPELLTPGEIYEYHLDMWQTGITVPVGNRLRVEVASAAFPIFSRNLNTGGHNETETEFISAHQTIYHDADYPSHILLPVIPDVSQ